MALGFFTHLAGNRAVAYWGCSEPASQTNPTAVAVIAEKGIDTTAERPNRWTDAMVEAADVVVTTGCGDTCPPPAGLEPATFRV
jgi:arsenate reductase (thioredoxin)